MTPHDCLKETQRDLACFRQCLKEFPPRNTRTAERDKTTIRSMLRGCAIHRAVANGHTTYTDAVGGPGGTHNPLYRAYLLDLVPYWYK